MLIKIILTLFILFAISRVVVRWRDGSIGIISLLLWSALWVAVDAFIWWPKASNLVARAIGVGRGIDSLLVLGIVALFYGLFRVYIKQEFLEHEITSLVRNLAILDAESQKKKAGDATAEHQG